MEQLNLFELEAIRLQDYNRRKAIVSTRIYIILLSILIAVLAIYSSSEGQNQVITIRNPSELEFKTLQQEYPNTLTCPCQQMTISYGLFIEIIPEYHPICSSMFVDEMWINLLFSYNITYYYPLDFRSSSSGQFQILSSLCSLAKRFLNDHIQYLLSNSFLTPIAFSPKSFDAQSESQSSFIRTSASNTFVQVLNIIRSTTHIDLLQTALQTSRWRQLTTHWADYPAQQYLATYFLDKNGTVCNCDIHSSCSSSMSGFFDLFGYESFGDYTPSISLLSNVTGFVVGCYPLESILQSSLECLFDLQCLNLILHYFPHSNITYLNRNQTKYSTDTLVKTLSDNLFLEKWTTKNSFTNYYNICAPLSCTYSYVRYNNILYIVTQIFGFLGGLIIVLRLCIPRLVIGCSKLFSNRSTNVPQIRLIERFRTLRQSVPDRLKKLNLFEKYDATRDDPYQVQTSLITTRFYIIMLCLTMCVLTIYVSTTTRTQTFNIENPSQTTFERLHSKYFDEVKCLCKEISIPLGNLISLSPEYHPVCSSLFLSSEWLNSLRGKYKTGHIFSMYDFQIIGQVTFDVIQTLCSSAESAITNSWFSFKQSLYVTEYLLPRNEMIARIQKLMNQYKQSTIVDFHQHLDMIRLHTMDMDAAALVNMDFYSSKRLSSNETFVHYYPLPRFFGRCSCTLSDACTELMFIIEYSNLSVYFDENPFIIVPGLLTGCFALQTVLQSTLECFYNQTCLDMIQTAIQSNLSIHIDILNQSQTRYSPNSSIRHLLNELMLEQWGDEIVYDRYYEQCSPVACTYTITKRNDITYILTFLISLYGGVSITLRILLSFFVRWIRNRYRPNRQSIEEQRLPERLSRLFTQLKMILKRYNIFEDELSLNNDQRRQKEIITTRIYIVLFIVSVTTLITFTALSTVTEWIIIESPTRMLLDEFRLNSRILPTLECSCQQIVIPYNSFISITPSFHQVCSSNFVNMTSDWKEILESYEIFAEFSYDNFYVFAIPQFRTLSWLCDVANKTLMNNLAGFQSKVFVSKIVQPYDIIHSQARSQVTQYQSSTCRTFDWTLDFIQEMAQGNRIVSSIQSNWYYESLRKELLAQLWIKPHSYGNEKNCSCGTNSMCSSQAMIGNTSIPGFRVGCYILSSLLQSTLECLYNLTCIDLFKSFYVLKNLTVLPLDAKLSSPNETVQSLVNRLFIDQWKVNISYDKYFQICAPRFCRYSIEKRFNFLYMITKLIGLCGGLSIGLKIVAPVILKIKQFFCRRRQNRIHS